MSRVRFDVFGPVRAWRDGVEVPLGAPRQRAVLAALALRAGEVVSSARIIDGVWGEEAPASCAGLVRTYLSRLRRVLGPGVVEHASGGYLVAPHIELDAAEVAALVTRARHHEAAGELTAAISAWREALGRADGEPLLGVPGPYAGGQRARLQELRTAALEDCLDAEVRAGRHAEVVAELTEAVADHPLRERLVGALVLALYRCGRQADALAAYDDMRHLLADELGVDPGAELAARYHAVLRADPALAVPSTLDEEPQAPRPCQLPADLTDFTGRDSELERVTGLLQPDAEAPPVVAVVGLGGAGKTALAVHAAHRVRDRFPDGQLHAHLAGAQPAPASAAEVLAQFLRALGVDAPDVPHSIDERAARFRSLLDGRRVLVVLDDAAGEAQVRPLVPAAPGCAVLVTSRNRLTGLEGAATVRLGVMDPESGVALLTRVARRGELDRAAEEVVTHCGLLPLAIRIAGARLAARPEWTVHDLARLLADERERLDELAAGDLQVRVTLSHSYAGQDEVARQALRRLALLDAPDFPAWVLPALLDEAGGRRVGRALERLVDAHLVESRVDTATGRPRYRLHDLVRAYARERAADEEPPEQRREAVARCLRRWRAVADGAEYRLQVRDVGAAELGQRGVPEDLVAGIVADPGAFFDSERAALVAGARQAAELGEAELALLLVECVDEYLLVRGLWDDWEALDDVLLAVARARRAPAVEAAALANRGHLEANRMRYGAAADHYEAALPLLREAGDADAVATVLSGLAVVQRDLGRLDDAMTSAQAAVQGFRELGNSSGAAVCELTLASVLRIRGDRAGALVQYERALGLCMACGAIRFGAHARRQLGMLHLTRHDPGSAEPHLTAFLADTRELGDLREEGRAELALAALALARGDVAAARPMLDRALLLARETRDQEGEVLALAASGELQVRTGRHAVAVDLMAQALRTWRREGEPGRVLRALTELREALSGTGDTAARRRAWDRAAQVAGTGPTGSGTAPSLSGTGRS